MEYHKRRSLNYFLQRTQTTLKTIVDSFAQVEEGLKNSYDSLDSKWQSGKDGFLERMIIDGCFMLENFRALDTPDYYDAKDPTFGNHGKLYFWPFIRREMLLLENQLPMLVLEMLLEITGRFDDATINPFFFFSSLSVT
ncbi:unnamed protein product, partial [Ilex paraguariensis]